jgi:hypothetical protein
MRSKKGRKEEREEGPAAEPAQGGSSGSMGRKISSFLSRNGLPYSLSSHGYHEEGGEEASDPKRKKGKHGPVEDREE